MSDRLQHRLAFADEHPRRFFLTCLMLLCFVCLGMLATGSFADPLPQFELQAQELVQTHRIAWDFLPVGYAGLLGSAYIAGSHWGLAGMHLAGMLMNAVLLLLTFVALRALLRNVCADSVATVAALLISLYPELLQGIKKISDTDATLLTILLVLLAIVKLRRTPGIAAACVAGLAFAAATLVRPNLALLPLLLLWALWGTSWRRWLLLAVTSIVTAVGLYCLVTAVIHGRPFLPQNGPYNLYAGANAHTEAMLRKTYNGEASVIQDMGDHGIPATLDWFRPANLPGVADARDDAYEPYYREQSQAFIRQHPATMVKLTALKLVTFLRPEAKRYHYSDKHKSHAAMAWLGFKLLEAMFVPAWLVMLGWSRLRRLQLGSSLILLTAFVYVVPFVLVNSDPRFRVALDLLLLADIVRMITLRRCQLRGFALPCVEQPGW